ncbi:hypothetical protein ARMSODRAFT_184887 [Armillaria solidipes]|uniref:Uncharacterized protein n=1 Tax=Armillaria solidipes TaxID=1076256 RepID=A0A2H3BCQ3_9AGAR|nr:hypothetical protein ARMSODRAFT_184887 [Armillaria solidipes]
MPQSKNIWMKLASLVVASVNPGTLSYIVAFVVVVVFSLDNTALMVLLCRLRVEAVKLEERYLQAYDDMSLTDLRSWRHYMWETKDIWVKARQHQREIVELRKALKLTIVRARRDELEAAFGHHGQEGREATGDEELGRTAVV